MGIGNFNPATRKFNLVLSIRHQASAGRLNEWRTAFETASQQLYDATDGQHQIGHIYVSNSCAGGRNADAWLLGESSGPSAAGGYPGLGQETVHQTLYADGRNRPVSIIVHEFGHYAYGLHDEYEGPAGDAECLGDNPPAGACIMETFTEDPSEFCAPLNHNAGSFTFQQFVHSESCWQTMMDRYPDLTLPSGLPEELVPAGAGVPTWNLLVPEQRFVLVVDRSNSMAGNKLAEAKYGADWWADAAIDASLIDVDGCSAPPPYHLGVVSYSHTVTDDFPLQLINDDADRQAAKDAIDLITAGGATSIGGGLRRALNQILAAGARAATQVIVLLTDGLQNSGEHPNTVLPDLVDNGVRVYTIGIGTSINSILLEEIATTTGGTFYRINPNQSQALQAFELRQKLMEISGISSENGGVVTTLPGSTNPGISEEEVYVEPGSILATFALSWDNPEDLLFLELISPDGETITLDKTPNNVRPIYSQRPYMGYQISRPTPGYWKLVVNPERVAEISHFQLSVFSQNPLIDGAIMSPWRFYRPGDVIPIKFQGYYKQPVNGLKVRGTVLTPGGESIPLAFAEDEDQEPMDATLGQSSTVFKQTSGPGTYTINVVAESDGESATFPEHRGRPGATEGENEQEPIPVFRRQFTLAVVVGEEPYPRAKTEPTRGKRGEELRVTLKGYLTHFKQGATVVDFGEGIDAGELKVLDMQTAVIPIRVDEEAEPGYRDVTISTEFYKETIEVEAGFQIVGRSGG